MVNNQMMLMALEGRGSGARPGPGASVEQWKPFEAMREPTPAPAPAPTPAPTPADYWQGRAIPGPVAGMLNR